MLSLVGTRTIRLNNDALFELACKIGD